MLTRKRLLARLKFEKEHLDWIGPEKGKKMAQYPVVRRNEGKLSWI